MHSFLFTLLPQAAIYKPSGQNRNLQWVSLERLNLPGPVAYVGEL
jgi:hypothetical protein